MAEKTPSLDEFWAKNKKFASFLGILTAVFAYGPGRCADFLKSVAGWLGEKAGGIIERALISFLEIGGELKDSLGRLVKIVSQKVKRWFWISVAVTAVYWLMLTIGVALQNGVIIAITGILVGLYFVIASWVLENAIYAGVLGYDFSKEVLAKILALSKAAIEKLGLEIESERYVLPSRQFLKEKLRDVRFIAVPYTAVAFWLALFPQWRFYGFMFILLIGAFSLAAISSFWKDWPGKLWRIYHTVSKWVLVAAIICFAVSSLFPQVVQNTGKFLSGTINGWAKSLNEPKADVKVKVEEKKAIKNPVSVKALAKVSAPDKRKHKRKRQARIFVPVRFTSLVRSDLAKEDDPDGEAAWSAYLKMEEMDRARKLK